MGMNDWKRWLAVFLYAAAMAWVEAAAVLYLRTLIDRVQPYQPNPLPVAGSMALIEVVREAATLLMLLTVGFLAGRAWRSRLGYAAIAFGVWDILYYVFLKTICGWPHSLLDWDILFLIPLPWWGPVLAPVLISLLLILWGTLASQFEHAPTPLLPGNCGLGLGRGRRRPCPSSLHGRHPGCRPPESRRDSRRVAQKFQLAALLRRPLAHGHAGAAPALAFLPATAQNPLKRAKPILPA